MSEDPAPYWIGFPHPYYSADQGGWRALFIWRDGMTGHELRAACETLYATYAEALLASQDLGDDARLRERLLAANPRDLRSYWRNRGLWL